MATRERLALIKPMPRKRDWLPTGHLDKSPTGVQRSRLGLLVFKLSKPVLDDVNGRRLASFAFQSLRQNKLLPVR